MKWLINILRDERGFCGIVIAGVVAAGAAVAGAEISSSGQQSAANTEAAAANNSTQVQWNEFLQQQQNIQPWLTAGTSAVNQLSTGMQPGGQFATVPGLPTYGMAQFQQDPLYQNMMTQQNNILASNRAGAAGGGSLGSGNQMVALQALAGQNAEGYYQQGYQNNLTGYNATLNQQNTEFNRLSDIAGTGQTAAGQISQAGQNAANNVANIGMNSANNIASTQIGVANAQAGMVNGIGNSLTSGLSNYNNQQQQQNLMNNLLASNNGMTYTPGSGYTYNNPAAVGPPSPY